ncbi:MAG: hypothetical protein IJ770_00195 [Alphaproteobacteria bacterium]|nr:hypothetical protein [Alphaproteobacteria bacterium]
MDIQQQIKDFRRKLKSYSLSESDEQKYVEIETRLLKSEQMPFNELLARAKKIKPLVRLDASDVDDCVKKHGVFLDSDRLCFCKPCDIKNRSYLYDFDVSKIVMFKGQMFAVPKRKKVGEFTCYHNTGTFYGFLVPSVDEVLQQIPAEIDWHTVDAFELSFPSMDFSEIYDCLLDRHISTVHLYRFDSGLPQKIKAQPVVFDGQRYK